MSDIDPNILISGSKVMLRDRLPTDVDSILRWTLTGEHRIYDAPWEGKHDSLTNEQIDKFKEGFLKQFEKDLPDVRGNAIIATLDNIPIGSLNRYFANDIQDAPFLGISIMDDSYLNQGYGTEAFRLWVDYHFRNSEASRIGAETWSFNPRAIRILEKIGFTLEGTQREMRVWKGKKLDKLLFGMLRREWESS